MLKKTILITLMLFALSKQSFEQQWLGGNHTDSVIHHNGGVYVGPYNSTWASTRYDSSQNTFVCALETRIESSKAQNIMSVISDMHNIPDENNDVLWVATRYYQPNNIGLFSVSNKDAAEYSHRIFTIRSNGNVGIGADFLPQNLLDVDGTMHAKEVKVDNDGWPDYVFNNDYKLISLPALESFINKNKHLPNIPSAEEVKENGLLLSKTTAKMLQKIEELTVYCIQENKKGTEQEHLLQRLNKKNDQQQQEINKLKMQVKKLLKLAEDMASKSNS